MGSCLCSQRDRIGLPCGSSVPSDAETWADTGLQKGNLGRDCMGAVLPCRQVYKLSHRDLRARPDAIQPLQEHSEVRRLGITLGQNRLVKAREEEREKLHGTQM